MRTAALRGESMPDETDTTETTAPVAVTTEQPASPPAEGKAFTQEDVNRIVAQRLAEDRSRRPAQPAPAPPKPAKPADSLDLASEVAALKQQQAELTARLDFEKRTKNVVLEPAKADALFKVYQASPAAFDEAVQVFGIKSTTPPVPQPAQTQPAQPAFPATDHPASNRGAPPPAQVPIEELDLWNATDSDRAAFIRSKGMREYNALLLKQGHGRTVKI